MVARRARLDRTKSGHAQSPDRCGCRDSPPNETRARPFLRFSYEFEAEAMSPPP